jgi:hypothetical protein
MIFSRMTRWRFSPGWLGILLLFATLAGVGHDKLTDTYFMSQSQQVAQPAKAPVYVPPPDISAPASRMGAGTRSLHASEPCADTSSGRQTCEHVWHKPTRRVDPTSMLKPVPHSR